MDRDKLPPIDSPKITYKKTINPHSLFLTDEFKMRANKSESAIVDIVNKIPLNSDQAPPHIDIPVAEKSCCSKIQHK